MRTRQEEIDRRREMLLFSVQMRDLTKDKTKDLNEYGMSIWECLHKMEELILNAPLPLETFADHKD